MFTPPAREQIHKDPYLIVIDCSMYIEIASISRQGWKIKAREPEIMKLIQKSRKFIGQH